LFDYTPNPLQTSFLELSHKSSSITHPLQIIILNPHAYDLAQTWAIFASEGERDIMGAGASIAKRWRLLQGSQRWEGLTDPLDSDLRKSILIYGDHCQATYDTFISDRRSKYAGSSRYGGPRFFDDLGLTKGRQSGDTASPNSSTPPPPSMCR
jgi:hypothetical protein